MTSWHHRIRRRGLLASIAAPVRYLWLRALRSPVSTPDLAMGFAIGVFWGCIPIFILHWPCAVFTAAVTGRSKIAATAGIFLSNPFTIPIQYSTAWLIGHQLLLDDSEGPVGFTSGEAILKAMMNMGLADLVAIEVGGLVMGSVLCVPAYLLSHRFAASFRSARAARRAAAELKKKEG
jgi:hypothetical protein